MILYGMSIAVHDHEVTVLRWINLLVHLLQGRSVQVRNFFSRFGLEKLELQAFWWMILQPLMLFGVVIPKLESEGNSRVMLEQLSDQQINPLPISRLLPSVYDEYGGLRTHFFFVIE